MTLRLLRRSGSGREADRTAPMDVAERLTTVRRGLFRRVTVRESTTLDDRETVTRWLRELADQRDPTVIIHRPWGSVTVVGEGRPPTDVLMSDGERMWYAAAPASTTPQKLPQLTPDQVEHVMLDALTSTSPPQWPDWKEF